MIELDQFDFGLLKLLQENNQLTAQELSAQVHLSPVSCLRRLRRLRAEKIIMRDVSIVDPACMGYNLTMIVLVSLEHERREIIDEFKRVMEKTPEVMQCYYVTGEIDFVIVINSANMSAYEDFTRKYFFENKNVRRFNTLVVMNNVKFRTALPSLP